jgi:hypothetical protein
MRFALLALVLACAACGSYDIPEPGASVAPLAHVRSVAVVGGHFEVTLDDGRLLAQQELVGAILTLDARGSSYRLRIDGAAPDPEDPTGDVILYDLSAENPDGGGWHNLCSPDPQGQQHAFPMAGTWTRDGRHLPSDSEFSITCTSGAEGKCVRFGYKPWARLADGSSLWDYHQACTRMVRADYCGDGTAHTRNGTHIDVYDRIGIQADDPEPGMSFEASWAPRGALCVRHPRYSELAPLSAVVAECPSRLTGRVGPDCTDDEPALIFNQSFAR